MAITDYSTTTLTTIQMVYNRAPFMAVTTNNTDIIKAFIWEAMNELEHCFQIGIDDATRVGKEQYYSVEMQSIIADLVAVYIMLLISAQNAQGTVSSSGQLRYLKKAKAGTSEVEWGEIDIKKSGVLNIGGSALIDKYEKSAARKARNLGCIIDICTDCIGPNYMLGMAPFITVTDCGCSNCD